MVLIVSDIHGQEEGEALIRAAIKRYSPTEVLSAGDQCPRCEELYMNMIAVRGNCDYWSDYISLPFPPLYRELTLFGHRAIMTHGHAYSPYDFSLKSGDIYIAGHTHIPQLEKENGIYFINPGSVSRPRSSKGPTAILAKQNQLSLISLLDWHSLASLELS